MAKFRWWSLLIVVSIIMASQCLLSAATSATIYQPDPLKAAYALTHPNLPCGWKVYVKTSDRYWAGTDAVVSLKIYDKSGDNITVSNLEKHGVKPGVYEAWNSEGLKVMLAKKNYNFFERGQRDEFVFEGRCLPYNICKVVLSHNNGGSSPGWFVDYITVQDGPDPDISRPHRFDFNRWLDNGHGLSATIDLCKS